MDFTVENMCGFLIRSRLMTPEDMKVMRQRWQAEAKEPGNVGQFTRWLAAREYVTEYQAGLLSKGHSDPSNFFLNQYRILDRLGRGRMAGVYKASHTLGQVVAIKVLPPSKAKNPQLMGRFQREATLAVKLKHPHTVRAFQVGEANGLHYLVMEYLEGETLDEVLARRKRLPPQEAVRLVHQALLGLQHIHEKNMVHRDVKPANLMLVFAPGAENPDTTAQATVKILDIGLGRSMFEEDNSSAGGQDGNLTAEGMILGTPDYLAPEQARDPSNTDIRADIYSLGCVLYHCLTGQPPFPDKNILNQMVRHATETPKPLKDFNPEIPDGLQQVVNWMMAKQPDGRYPTPERAAQALQVFLLADAAPSPTTSTGQGSAGAAQRQYLSWLDELPPEAAAPPRAKPAIPPPSPMPQPAKKLKRDRKAGVDKPAAGASTPALAPRAKAEAEVAASELADIDVELAPWPDATAGADGWLGFSHRDWLFLGIGAGAVFVVFLVGFVIAMIFQGE